MYHHISDDYAGGLGRHHVPNDGVKSSLDVHLLLHFSGHFLRLLPPEPHLGHPKSEY